MTWCYRVDVLPCYRVIVLTSYLFCVFTCYCVTVFVCYFVCMWGRLGRSRLLRLLMGCPCSVWKTGRSGMLDSTAGPGAIADPSTPTPQSIPQAAREHLNT